MRTESKKRLVLHVVAGAVAAGAGLGIGFSLRNPAGGAEKPERLMVEGKVADAFEKSSESTVRKQLVRGSQLGRQLEKDLLMSDPVTHWLYWLDAIEKANLSDMPSLVGVSGGDATLLRMIGERWMAMDPRNLFDWLIAREGSMGGVKVGPLDSWFRREWAKRDPEALIKALGEAPAFGNRRSWRSSVAAGIMEVNAELGLSFMHKWQIDDFGPRMDSVAKWAAKDPRHAAEFALAHPAGHATELTLETIGKEWAKQDGEGALAFATSGPDELGLKAKLAEAAMKSWAEGDLAKAGEWLAGTEDSLRDRLSPHLVEAWAKSDPARALVWCEQNLKGTALKHAAGGVLKGAAEKDVEMAARLVMVMAPSPARSSGAVAVMEKWMPDSFSGKSVAREAMEWLGNLDPASRREALKEVHWRWAGTDPKSLADFVLEQSDGEMPREVYRNVVNQLARKFPLEAMEWSGKVPEGAREEVAAEAFNAWRRFQPDRAMEWLDELPARDPRRDPLFESAVTEIARFEREAAEQFAAWPPDVRAAAREILEGVPLEAEKKAKFLGVLE